jgi:hypothetical protein
MRKDPALTLPRKPSIAVLPFHNMSSDPTQEFLADGMVEEITTLLSHIRQFLVIARNSSFTYKGQVVTAKQVGRELGVGYILEGRVRRAANRGRVTAVSHQTGSPCGFVSRSRPQRVPIGIFVERSQFRPRCGTAGDSAGMPATGMMAAVAGMRVDALLAADAVGRV